MPDRLGCLVQTIIGSLPIEDPHAQQRQQRSVVNLHLINNSEPFSPSDHVGPQPIIEIQVQEDIAPPAMVGSRLVLPRLANPVEGVLGNLQLLFSVSIKKKRRERLPQASLDNVPIQTTGYTLRC